MDMGREGGIKSALIYVFLISIVLSTWGCDQLGGKKEAGPKAVPKPPPAPTTSTPQQNTSGPAPTAAEERDYVYDPTGKRDPFQPFIATQTPVLPSGEEVPITPLQKFDISQLKLVAIMVGTGEGKAMVEDSEGKGYIVEKGVYVGRNFGKVKSILKDRVIIEERYKDYMGQVKTKDIVLQLHPPGEEKQP
jgi:type IV pilus assembly protein PilP